LRCLSCKRTHRVTKKSVASWRAFQKCGRCARKEGLLPNKKVAKTKPSLISLNQLKRGNK